MSDRRYRRDDAFLAEIARQYNAHVAARWPPTRAIAVAHGVSHGTAANWLVIARRRGFLHGISSAGLRHNYTRPDQPEHP